MPNDTFPIKLLQLEGFQNKYLPLLLESVKRQFPILVQQKNIITIDIKYLLSCASIFAQSNNGNCQDIALRIAQYILTCPEIENEYKDAAVIILDTMTNYPAISLAKERKYIMPNNDYSLPFKIDMLKRQINYSLWNEAKNNILHINKFQEKVFHEYLLTDALSISAPTSSGKSFILLQIILDLIKNNNRITIIYIVPSRALIQQVTADINEIFKQNKIYNTSISSVPTYVEDEYVNHVFVLTQERLHWLLEENKLLLPDCMIVDEAHKIDDSYRGVILQEAIEEVSRRNSKAKVLFASPMTSNPEILLNMLESNVKKKDLLSEQVTVNQNLIWVNCIDEKNKLWKMQLCINNKIIDIGTFNTISRATSPSKRMPYVAFVLSNNEGGNLIYANGAAEAEKIARILFDLQSNDSNDKQIEELIKLVKKSIHNKYDLVTVLKRRIAFHYGNMPLLIKNEIERLFKSGCIKFLVCTSTLMEGVNLPAKSIFVRGPQKGHNKPMNAMDFWNLAGRAGRQGKEFQGNVICIDTNIQELWKDSLYDTKVKYSIKSSIQDVLYKKYDEFINYLEADLEGSLKSRDSLFDHSLTYLLGDFIRYKDLNISKYKNTLSQDQITNLNRILINILGIVSIPQKILLKHQGVSPIAQQNLLNYFNDYNKNFKELIPLVPEDTDAVLNYTKIINRISKHIEGTSSDKFSYYRAMLVVKWMRGYTLARIISENENYFKEKNIDKAISAIIRNTMSDIEQYVRFTFVKYSSCYIDILKYSLSITNNELINQIPTLNLWLEFGASQDTQISLMNLGLSRTTAITLSNYITQDNLNLKQCVEWLNNNHIETLDISEIMKKEIENILKLSYLNN